MLFYTRFARQAGKHKDAAVAQSVERRIGSAEVTGPIPVSSFENPLRDQGIFCVNPVAFAPAVAMIGYYLATDFNFPG